MRKLENSAVQLGTDILLRPLNLDVSFESGESKDICIAFLGGQLLLFYPLCMVYHI